MAADALSSFTDLALSDVEYADFVADRQSWLCRRNLSAADADLLAGIDLSQLEQVREASFRKRRQRLRSTRPTMMWAAESLAGGTASSGSPQAIRALCAATDDSAREHHLAVLDESGCGACVVELQRFDRVRAELLSRPWPAANQKSPPVRTLEVSEHVMVQRFDCDVVTVLGWIGAGAPFTCAAGATDVVLIRAGLDRITTAQVSSTIGRWLRSLAEHGGIRRAEAPAELDLLGVAVSARALTELLSLGVLVGGAGADLPGY